MSSTAVKLWLSVLLVALAAYAGWTVWRVSRLGPEKGLTGTLEPIVEETPIASGESPKLADFTFTERSGKPFSLGELAGQVWVAGFFFASCPGPCTTMNRAVAELQQQVADLPVRFVSITVDPDNDMPDVLRRYAAGFGADEQQWLFLTGPFSQTQRLGTEYFKVPVARQMHTERLLLVDRNGEVRGTFNATQPAQMQVLRAEIERLVARAEPADDEEHAVDAPSAAGSTSGTADAFDGAASTSDSPAQADEAPAPARLPLVAPAA